ncbi:MAG: hypothetical protein OXH94_09320 [Rhodospirillales bacterium]|nr:hypothetical protein [Rhodospirillales bacterium]
MSRPEVVAAAKGAHRRKLCRHEGFLAVLDEQRAAAIQRVQAEYA